MQNEVLPDMSTNAPDPRCQQPGCDTAADALRSAYDAFHAEPDAEAPPRSCGHRRVAQFDALWD